MLLTSCVSINTINFIVVIDTLKGEDMNSQDSSKVFKSNGFRALFVGFGGLFVVLLMSACSPLSAVKSTLAEDPFPPMPAPEVATYVLDLSGSTNPTAELQALGSGISDFVAGQSLGNPFAQNPVAPRGLSIQFVTENSAQAPRILLVSTRSSQELYQFIKDKSPNIEGARQLWEGLIRARTEIWQTAILEMDSSQCESRVIKTLGRQQLLPDELQDPANLICQDARRVAQALSDMTTFIKHPGIPMGSDVEGAISISLKNLIAARSEFPSASLSLIVASDLVDEVSLNLPTRLSDKTAKSACALAIKDAGASISDNSLVTVVLVGVRNSTYGPKILNLTHSYWKCYFKQIGITHISEQSDLQGF
jgi:hypothetical protein